MIPENTARPPAPECRRHAFAATHVRLAGPGDRRDAERLKQLVRAALRGLENAPCRQGSTSLAGKPTPGTLAMRPRPGCGVRDASARASDAAVEHGRAPGRTMLPGGEEMTRRSDRPEIVADAARTILTRPSRACADRVFIDDEVLVAAGVGALDACACAPGAGHEPDILGEPWEGAGAT